MINKLKKKQWFWDFLNKISQLYPIYFFTKMPKEIIIEPTNACNLRCPVCPTHFAMKRQRGFLEIDLFKSIIDEFKNIKIKPRIAMNFSGEPLFNKDLDKFVAYANENGHKTFVSTNATMLSKDIAIKLINAGLSSIHLCLDGISKESQEAYRVGSNFETVKDNIETFLKTRSELKKDNPYVSIQVLLTSYSENEMDDMIEWAKSIGADNINFKSLSMGTYTTPEMKEKYSYLLPKNKKYRRKVSNINKTLCTIPTSQALVYWNGNMGLCCVDFDNVVKMPSIAKDGFIKTFTSVEAMKKRKLGFRKKLGICRNCSIGNADYMGFNFNLKDKKDV